MSNPDARSPVPAPADTALSGLRPLGRAQVFLQTRRMTLFEFAPEQALDLLRLGLEQRVAEHILDAPLNTLAEVSGMLVYIERIYRERPGLGMWYATDRHGFLGKFSLMPSTEEGQVEIGTRLLPRAWGRGYALEGGAALVKRPTRPERSLARHPASTKRVKKDHAACRQVA